MIFTIILLIVAFTAYAVMWALQFHYYQSIFKNLDKHFWNPMYSWQNKYKHDLKTPAFWGSTTIFVTFTDGFHLSQFFFLNCITLAIAINIESYPWYYNWIGIRIVFAIVFNLMFDKILIKK